MGLSLLALALALGSSFVSANPLIFDRIRHPDALVFLLVVTPVLTGMLGFAKVSVMAIWFALLTFAFVRWQLFRQPVSIASILLSAVVFVLVARLVVENSKMVESFKPRLFLIFARKDFDWQRFYYYSFLVLTWTSVILLKLASKQVRSLGDVRDVWQRNELVDLEIVAVVALVGNVPGMVMTLSDWNVGPCLLWGRRSAAWR